MSNRFSVAGRMSAATAATADMGSHLWNPHASISLFVREVHYFKTAATVDNIALVRTTTIGATPGATVAPDIDNQFSRSYAPISVAVLYLATFATYPVVAGPYMLRAALPAAIGSGVIWIFPEPIEVPAGTGLGVVTPVAVALQIADISYVWDE